jgi:hypothetical protein
MSILEFIQGINVRLMSLLSSKSLSGRKIRIANLVLLAFLLVPIAATQRLPASFSSKTARMVVEIDGVSYGAFPPVAELDEMVDSIESTKDARVTLSRDFVTDPSLYLWANSLMQGNTGLKDVTLISENAEGVEVARHRLRMSQPVAWTVESGNPEVGGLHEKVVFAVHKVERL